METRSTSAFRDINQDVPYVVDNLHIIVPTKSVESLATLRSTNPVPYMMAHAAQQVRMFDWEGPLTAEKFVQEIRAAWRTGFTGLKIARGIRMGTTDRDPEVMLQIILRVYGQKRSIPELIVKCFHEENGSSETLQDSRIVCMRRKKMLLQKKSSSEYPHFPMYNAILRDYCIFWIKDATTHTLL